MAEKTKDILSGFAGFAMSDVADAKRRHPDSDLSGYAQSRDLRFLGNTNPAGYFAAVPGLDLSLQFNVMRGYLKGGRHGVLFHHRLAWPADRDDGPYGGTFYGVYFNSGRRFQSKRKNALFFVPVVGDLLQPDDDPSGKQMAVGIPVTVGATLVSEAAGITAFTIDNLGKPWMTGAERIKLKERDLPGWDLLSAKLPDPGFIDRFLNPTVHNLLAEMGEAYPYSFVSVDHGTLIVRVNGYLDDPEKLDWLAQITSTIGNELAKAALGLAEPKPFATELSLTDWPPQGLSMSGRFPPSPWLERLHATADQIGMPIEDPAEFHRAFPKQPVPGKAFAVFRSTDSTGVTARVAMLAERSINRDNIGRNAVLWPAAPKAKETPIEGIRLDDGYSYGVRDGIFAVWVKRDGYVGELGDVNVLISRATEIARETKLAVL